VSKTCSSARQPAAVSQPLAILLGLAVLLSGCATQPSQPSTNSSLETNGERPSPSLNEPRTVTDLSQISSAPVAAAPISQPALPDLQTGANPSLNPTVQQNVESLFIANVDQLRYHEGKALAPGDTSLLNDKARKFSGFSYQLLNQTLAAARNIEPDRLEGRKLPEDIAPMVLTAVMDSQGRLTEISIESHTGDHQIDQIIIDSCKQGLWSRNPPAQALGSDGNYRLRVRGYIRAYSFDYRGQYKYQTEFGLAIL
jgi:hypothetical protein